MKNIEKLNTKGLFESPEELIENIKRMTKRGVKEDSVILNCGITRDELTQIKESEGITSNNKRNQNRPK